MSCRWHLKRIKGYSLIDCTLRDAKMLEGGEHIEKESTSCVVPPLLSSMLGSLRPFS